MERRTCRQLAPVYWYVRLNGTIASIADCTFAFILGLETYTVHFAANGVRGEELLTMESPRIKLLVPQAAERARLKHRLKELRAAADKDKRNRERERKEREKLQRKAEKLAEKASRKK